MSTEAAESVESVGFDDIDSDGVVDAEPETEETVVADGEPNAGEGLRRPYITDWFYGKLWLSIFRGRRRKREDVGTRLASCRPSKCFPRGSSVRYIPKGISRVGCSELDILTRKSSATFTFLLP